MIFLWGLRARSGTFGMVRLLDELTAEGSRIRQQYAFESRRYETEIGHGVVEETQMLVSMFNVIARREGREHAYPVIRDMMTDVGPHSMRAMYQIDELVECDGDGFENFKRFHMAMFGADSVQTVYRNTRTDSGDSFTSPVDHCASVEIFTELGCPELAPFGCDHDLAGYPAITDTVQAELRRPCTIAKGGNACEFRFHRTGTAPDTELVDGVEVTWEPSLDRSSRILRSEVDIRTCVRYHVRTDFPDRRI